MPITNCIAISVICQLLLQGNIASTCEEIGIYIKIHRLLAKGACIISVIGI